MAFSINQVVLVGNISKDPELKFTTNNNPVLNFNMATNRSQKDGEGWKDVATFHRVVVWGKIAEYLGKVLVKGDQVTVTGRIDNRSYEQDGVKKYISEVVADNVIPPRKPKQDVQAQSTQTPTPTPTKKGEDVDVDDIPF